MKKTELVRDEIQPTSDSGVETIDVTATIKLTPDQWRELKDHFKVREITCGCGVDNPQVTDFVMFQLLRQLPRDRTTG